MTSEGVNEKMKIEINSQQSAEDGGLREDSTPDADITETESKRRFLINANAKLREGIKHFSERQDIMEELIEVECGNINQAIQRFSVNKGRFRYVLGYSAKDVGDPSSRNDEKYKKISYLVRITNEFWKYQRANFPSPKHEDMMKRYEAAHPQELKDLGLVVRYDNGAIGRTPAKKCRKCLDTVHGTKSCPYKKVASRTPEVVAQIQERLEQWKKVEGIDPLITQGYKKKIFKMKKHELKEIHNLDDNEDDDDEFDGAENSS